MSSSIPQSMKAVAIDRFGGIDQMQVKTLPVPPVGADEVLMRVDFAGVAVWDPMEREGLFAKMMNVTPKFPVVLGSEGAGELAAVGAKIREFKVGDRAYAAPFLNPKGGSYAEYAVVKADVVSKIPGKLTLEQAAVMPWDAGTALRGLDVLQVKAGESVMIFGAGGGLGHLATQLAKRLGARVLAIASGDDGVALAKKIGADVVVNGRKDDVLAAMKSFAPVGVDAALLSAGGEVAEKSLTAMRPGGRVAYPNGVEPAPKLRPGLETKAYDGNVDAEVIHRLNRLIEAGPFIVHVAQTFPLDQAADAHRMLDTHYIGKLALRIR